MVVYLDDGTLHAVLQQLFVGVVSLVPIVCASLFSYLTSFVSEFRTVFYGGVLHSGITLAC